MGLPVQGRPAATEPPLSHTPQQRDGALSLEASMVKIGRCVVRLPVTPLHICSPAASQNPGAFPRRSPPSGREERAGPLVCADGGLRRWWSAPPGFAESPRPSTRWTGPH